jgi:2,3-bisphosphoglycerate-dependent phosphoglycerate mutase
LSSSLLSASTTIARPTQPQSQSQSQEEINASFVHTLLLCRHGDSIWNGGEPGCRETFTGWTNVPLSQKGIAEAQATGRQVAQFERGIDVCCTSILQRAQLTAHYCMWAFAEKPNVMSPRTYIQDYRLNERHYGALQGLVKEDVEQGKYGHDSDLVQQWRRSWYTVPPLLEEDDDDNDDDNNNDNNSTDPRRKEELKAYANYCGGAEFVPRGESLEQVAQHRIRPFLKERLCPVLEQAAQQRLLLAKKGNVLDDDTTTDSTILEGGTGLIVAHANSLRALIGLICNVQEDPQALAKLEQLRLQTGVPLVLRFRQQQQQRPKRRINGTAMGHYDYEDYYYQPCDMDGIPFTPRSSSNPIKKRGNDDDDDDYYNRRRVGLVPELPVYPLSSIPTISSNVRRS